MGGFYSSKKLEEMIGWFDYNSEAELEIYEQCIAMTKVFETGNFNDFLAFYKLFNKEAIDHYKGVPMSDMSKVAMWNILQASLAPNKTKPANHNDIYGEEK
jgi:hypothetical protein